MQIRLEYKIQEQKRKANKHRLAFHDFDFFPNFEKFRPDQINNRDPKLF